MSTYPPYAVPVGFMIIALAAIATLLYLAKSTRKSSLMWHLSVQAIVILQTVSAWILIALCSIFASPIIAFGSCIVAFLACCICDMFVISKMKLSANRRLQKERLKMAERQQDLALHRTQILSQQAKTASLIRSDLLKELDRIELMIADNRLDKAASSSKVALEMIEQVLPRHFCQNRTVDAILHHKAQVCEDAKVDLSVQVVCPKDTPFDSLTLCSLFSNLIDNALHACQELPPEQRRISVFAKESKGFYLIRVENTTVASDSLNFKKHKTTSPDREHGWGLQIASQLAESNEGRLNLLIEPSSENQTDHDVKKNLLTPQKVVATVTLRIPSDT